MSLALPASSEPTGAQRPFDMQVITVLAGAANSLADVPVATTALKSRAPSRCSGRFPIAAFSATRSRTFQGVPPEGMCVFSTVTIAMWG